MLGMENRNGDSNPFADYMWMGEMDKFDEEIEAQIEKEFQEEEFIRSCIEQLLEEEEEQTVYFQSQDGPKQIFPPKEPPQLPPPATKTNDDQHFLEQMNQMHINSAPSYLMQQQQQNNYHQNPSFYTPKPIPNRGNHNAIPFQSQGQYRQNNQYSHRQKKPQPSSHRSFNMERRSMMNPEAQEFVPRSSRNVVATTATNGIALVNGISASMSAANSLQMNNFS